MLEGLKNFTRSAARAEKQNIYISKYVTTADGGRRDLFEALFYRETCIAEEKQNSSLLSVTLDKLIKAMAPLK